MKGIFTKGMKRLPSLSRDVLRVWAQSGYGAARRFATPLNLKLAGAAFGAMALGFGAGVLLREGAPQTTAQPTVPKTIVVTAPPLAPAPVRPPIVAPKQVVTQSDEKDREMAALVSPPAVTGEASTPLTALYEEPLPEAVYGHDPLPEEVEAPQAPQEVQALDELVASLNRPQVSSETPQWLRNAAHWPGVNHRPMIAVVIDDLGLDRARTRRVIGLPGPLTTAFLPYAEDLDSQTGKARTAGHELMVHVSMEPSSSSIDPGPNTLRVGESLEDIRTRLTWALGRFDGYVGINNHMGSKFTSDAQGMAAVMTVLRERGLLFLDSRTAGTTKGAEAAQRLGVPYAERNVFLDNVNEVSAVQRQLRQLENAARRKGYAVGIGHPKEATIQALAPWLDTLEDKGFVLVPMSAIVHRRFPEVTRVAKSTKN
ncbi:MAG: divergent polysaccharide deacetylase family protein [Magnetospiraceae bacterium]